MLCFSTTCYTFNKRHNTVYSTNQFALDIFKAMSTVRDHLSLFRSGLMPIKQNGSQEMSSSPSSFSSNMQPRCTTLKSRPASISLNSQHSSKYLLWPWGVMTLKEISAVTLKPENNLSLPTRHTVENVTRAQQLLLVTLHTLARLNPGDLPSTDKPRMILESI